MARSVASKIWQQFFQANPFDCDSGAKYRAQCLAHGGGKPSRALVGDLLGRPVDANELCDALVTELDEKQDTIRHLLQKAK